MKKGRLVTPLRDKLMMLSLLSVAAFILWYIPAARPESEFDNFALGVAFILFSVLILLLALSQLFHYIWSSLNADGRE